MPVTSDKNSRRLPTFMTVVRVEVVCQAVRQGKEVDRRVRAARCGEYGATRDIEVREAMHSAVGIHDPFRGPGAHAGGSHMVEARGVDEHLARRKIELEAPASRGSEFLCQ